VNSWAAPHVCVRLSADSPAVGTDVIQLIAFTKGENAPDVVVRSGATLHLESAFIQDGCLLFKFREGQVIAGFSGGPLLNLRTGDVCALNESSRSTTSDLGGFGVPISTIVESLDASLIARNQDFHANDRQWADAAEAQRVAELERRGQHALMPLLSPMSELEWGDDDPPSELLRARYSVVPFVQRGDLLDNVMKWRESDRDVSILILAGSGGIGKTRTAAELCQAAEQAGWRAGFLDAEPDGQILNTELLYLWPGRLLIAVDYAETRPNVVLTVAKNMLRHTSIAPRRLVLIIRQQSDKKALMSLFATGDASDDVARLLRRAEFVHLEAPEFELDRHQLFDLAKSSFSALLRTPLPDASALAPNLRDEHFERPLFVTAAALLAVASPEVQLPLLGPDELLNEILNRHEAAYWARSERRANLGLHPEDQRIAISIIVLGGNRNDDSDDMNLVRMVPSLRDASSERLTNVLRWLRSLYEPDGLLEPDLLAEALVANTTSSLPGLIEDFLSKATSAQLARGLSVLTRTAARSDLVRTKLTTALNSLLPELVERTDPAEGDLIVSLRLAIREAVPGPGAVAAQLRIHLDDPDLTDLGGEIGTIAISFLKQQQASGQSVSPQLIGDALLHFSECCYLANHAADAGFAAASEAASIYRTLLKQDVKYRGHLGQSLLLMSQLGGRAEGALFTSEHPDPVFEATIILQHERGDSGRLSLRLADSLRHEASVLSEQGRSEEALSRISEAIDLYAAETSHGRRLQADLGNAVADSAKIMFALERFDLAVAAGSDAERIFRGLLTEGSDRFKFELASALNIKMEISLRVGDFRGGLEAGSEAIGILNDLWMRVSSSYLPALAEVSLTQSRLLDGEGVVDGLAPVSFAVRAYRSLVDAEPERFSASLASALALQARLLLKARQSGEAIEIVNEAINIFREIDGAGRRADPWQFSAALELRAFALMQGGFASDALAQLDEALEVIGRVRHQNSLVWKKRLASIYETRASHLVRMARADEGHASMNSAVDIWRKLAEVNREAYTPDLVKGLESSAKLAVTANHLDEANDLLSEAIDLCRALAPSNNLHYWPRLVDLLCAHADVLTRFDAHTEALRLVEEARSMAEMLLIGNRFLSVYLGYLTMHATTLLRMGNPEAAREILDRALIEHESDAFRRGAILLQRANLTAHLGSLAEAAEDALRAEVALMEEVRFHSSLGEGQAGNIDVRRHVAEARDLLRRLRLSIPSAQIWPGGDEMPAWLRFPEPDRDLILLIESWVGVEGGIEEKIDFLMQNARSLVTDLGESALYQLIDANPHAPVLDVYLEMLQSARRRGVVEWSADLLGSIRAEQQKQILGEWSRIADASESQKFLTSRADQLLNQDTESLLRALVRDNLAPLVLLGILGSAQEVGIAETYRLQSEPDEITRALDVAQAATLRLRLSRMSAGLRTGDPVVQLVHAASAMEVGEEEEAFEALQRCVEVCPSWERPRIFRALGRLGVGRPDLAVDVIEDHLRSLFAGD
jgi:tetratricopeptide (TPR) repeat protein